MPREKQPPRLYLRTPRGRQATWYIRYEGREHSTGCAEGDVSGAENALTAFRARLWAKPKHAADPSEVLLETIFILYAREVAPETADPERIKYAIAALNVFWAGMAVDKVTGANCRAYARHRRDTKGVKPGTIRKELGTLSTALNYAHKEGVLTSAPPVTLPPKPEAKNQWMTRDEVARLVAAARSHPDRHHLARAILIGVYTGTRPGAVYKLQWEPNATGGHVDLNAGVIYRKSARTAATKKRQPPVKIPPRLLSHLRRWRGLTRTHVIEFRGHPIIKPRTGWDTLRRESGVNVTPHVWRHTAATWLMQKGVNIWNAAGYLGMDEATLRDVYGHHHPDFQGEAVEAIGRR